MADALITDIAGPHHVGGAARASELDAVAGTLIRSPWAIFLARLRSVFLGRPVESRIASLLDDRDADPETRLRLARVAQLLLRSYNIALEASPFGAELYLRSLAPELRGFATEGVAMAFILRDRMRPRGSLIGTLRRGPSAPYALYMHIGCGLFLALARRPVANYAQAASGFTAPMIIDGYGFGTALFTNAKAVDKTQVPKGITGPSQRIFDHGVGRALWFAHCGKVADIAAAIRRFPQHRQADLWQGLGTAAAHNAASGAATAALVHAAGQHAQKLAIGAALSAWIRHHCADATAATNAAAAGLAGRDVTELVAATKTCVPAHPLGSAAEWVVFRDQLGHLLAADNAQARGRKTESANPETAANIAEIWQ